MSPVERATDVLRFAELAHQHHRSLLRPRDPGVTDDEIQAPWLEQTFRGAVPGALLDKVRALLRQRSTSRR